MGKSATGKSTLMDDLVNTYPDKYHVVKSYSTREPRDAFDQQTHVFVCEEYRQAVKKDVITDYASPKGYHNWTDKTCFHPDKINLYAIDSIACNDEFYPYCQKNGWKVTPVYLHVSRRQRYQRFLGRGGKKEDFSNEKHLSFTHLKMPFKYLNITNLNRNEVVSLFIKKVQNNI